MTDAQPPCAVCIACQSLCDGSRPPRSYYVHANGEEHTICSSCVAEGYAFNDAGQIGRFFKDGNRDCPPDDASTKRCAKCNARSEQGDEWCNRCWNEHVMRTKRIPF